MLFNQRPGSCMGQPGPMMGPDMYDGSGCPGNPIVEQPFERCMTRNFCHEIQQECQFLIDQNILRDK